MANSAFVNPSISMLKRVAVRLFGVVAALSGLIAGLAVDSADSASFKYRTIRVKGSSNVGAAAGNAHDEIVGSTVFPQGFAGTEGFVWSKGSVVLVSQTGGFNAINDDGITVGSYRDHPGNILTYDVATQAITPIPISKTGEPYVSGINNLGVLVGTIMGKKLKDEIAFEYFNGSVMVLSPPNGQFASGNAINRAGAIALASKTFSYIYVNGKYKKEKIPMESRTFAQFITDDGSIGGSLTQTEGVQYVGFTKVGGSYTIYNPPGSVYSDVGGIGPAGQVVGFYSDGQTGHGFISYDGAYYAIDVPGAASTSISGITTSGSIFGTYGDGAGNYAAFIGQCPKIEVCTQ